MALKPGFQLVMALFTTYNIVASASKSIVNELPGFPAPLPFNLETGYVKVDGLNDVNLFYYFIESENDPSKDPLVLWLSGGPGCSGFSGLVYEIGPLQYDFSSFDGGLPSLTLNPYSWTKIANMLFLDAPAGTGFSYATSEPYNSDSKTAQDTVKFLIEWLLDHPRFSRNPLYVAGDSYAGKLVPLVVHEIAKGDEACDTPYQSLQLQGYILGNPLVNYQTAVNSKFIFVHRMGLISDEYYELARKNCNGEFFYVDPDNVPCLNAIQRIKECISKLDPEHILEVNCGGDQPESDEVQSDYRFNGDVLFPSWHDKPWCRKYSYLLSYAWANNPHVQEALHVRNGTISKWKRCYRNIPYVKDVTDVLEYHYVLTKEKYRVLAYSGDHDMVIPYIGTIGWIRSLNLTMDENWRPWFVDDEIAGYTEKYKQHGYNITFATVKASTFCNEPGKKKRLEDDSISKFNLYLLPLLN
ncbi:serine carboxypeptidase-like 2 [Daucus carota subsp. sativus]|uniref:serine carboxypeptidase-like 2 n=1 Tax=Daucus carota subsp. sativus TaxID=79200 RepID=UPI00308360B6